MRRQILILLLGALLAACSGPAPVPVKPTISVPATELPTATAIPHADELRFGLVGQPTDVNVWALFDEAGASYANYALHSGEYPRLYRLSVPGREFEPFVAEGLPSAVTREGNNVYATVTLRPGLQWSDGSPLTAQDVAFTVNTALTFRLGLDWLAVYDPDRIDHVEAVDDATVRYYFNTPITVADWQYGALQGPILSQAYWSSKLNAASTLLPAADLVASLNTARAQAAELQGFIDEDNAQLLESIPNSPGANELSARISRHQDDLNSANTQISKLQDEYDAALTAAHAALYALADEGEPTFGPFLRATKNGEAFTREVNPLYPFEKPNYDRAVYQVYEIFNVASQDYEQSKVDILLSSYGAGQTYNALSYPTSSARFLVFNPANALLSDRAFRAALACVIDANTLLSGQEWGYDGFVLPGPWSKAEPLLICSGLSKEERLQKAVSLLKEAGYSWVQEPTVDQAGHELRLPNGQTFPALTLLTTSPDVDLSRANLAAGIEKQTQYLGISLTMQQVSLDALHYAAYSTGKYDMAILGWTLSEYPGYLCEWFQAPSPFAYNGDSLKSACETLDSTADLDAAYQAAQQIQSNLAADLPFIPLYLRIGYENHQHVTYPFGAVLNGLSNLYGAPSLAIPSQ